MWLEVKLKIGVFLPLAISFLGYYVKIHESFFEDSVLDNEERIYISLEYPKLISTHNLFRMSQCHPLVSSKYKRGPMIYVAREGNTQNSLNYLYFPDKLILTP